MRFIAVLLVLACWVSPASALQLDKSFHHHVRDRWSIEHGLPQISAIAITQDREGYLWVGTQAGIARFDGVRFSVFTPENEPALPGTWVRVLYTARDGRVWVGTYKGAAVHDGRRFTAVTAADPQRWPTLDVQGFAEDAAGTTWVATTAGLFRADGARLAAVKGSPDAATAVQADAHGVWVGTHGAVHRLQGAEWRRIPLPDAAAGAPVTRLAPVGGRLWAATPAGLFVLEDGHWEAFTAAPALRDAPIEALRVDRAGNLWAGGDAGLVRLRGREVVEFVAPDGPGGVRGLRAIFEDREGNLWLGSQWESLIRIRDSWTRRYGAPEGLVDPILWSVAPDPDGRRTWVGGTGVDVFEDGRFRQVVPASALPHPEAYNLLAEPGRLWIGTRRGLALLDHAGPHAGQVRQLPLFAPMAQAQINGIVRDGERVWFPTTQGLFRLQGGALRRFGPADGLEDERARFVHIDNDGMLVGTQSGLYARHGERFTRVGTDSGLPDGLDITTILRLSDGRLVVGALSERTWFRQDGRWHELGPAQGMPANAPFFMTEHDGYLWVAGMRGITRVALARLDSLARGRSDSVPGEMLLNERGDPLSGQQGYCCNGAGNAKGFLRGSSLWLPTRDGMVAMDTDAIRTNPVAPNVVVERAQRGGEWVDAAALSGTELPADSRDLSFQFTVLSFQDPESNHLEYRLDGYDTQWTAAGPQNRTARYTNLPPGDYVFEVRGRNNAGVPAAAPARVAFSIAPRFHETAWFWLALALMAGLSAYALHRYQLRRHRIQREALELLVQQRTHALAEANERLREISHTDPLTGLRNRRYMTTQMPVDLAYYDRELAGGVHQGEVMLFVLVDVDHFKDINDRHGHRAGDLVLQQFAAVLGSLVRTGDYVVRWGGEEFLLVLRPMSPQSVGVIGERLRRAVADHPFDIGGGQPLRLTCSVGIAEYPLFRDERGAAGWETMVELADQAMYFVKTHGRDGWAAFRPTAGTRLSTLLQDLKPGPGPLVEAGRLELLGTHQDKVGAMEMAD